MSLPLKDERSIDECDFLGPCELIEDGTSDALVSVLAERDRQDKLWGEQNHHPRDYFLILTEEVGELATEIAGCLTTLPRDGKEHDIDTVREEAVHVAAVALAMIESIDRGTWVQATEEYRKENE